MGTSSSEAASSVRGMRSTSSSEQEEEQEEKDGEADRAMELVEEEDGEALKRKRFKPSVWKMEARVEPPEGTATGGVVAAGGAGGA